MAKKGDGLFPEVDQIKALLSGASTQEIVILAVPSHDKKNKELGEAAQGEWATHAMKLFADLYRGATAFKAEQGVYKTDDGVYLFDQPIMIESFAQMVDIENVENLNELVGFCKRLGKETDQASVMLAIGRVMIYIEDYSGV